MLTFNVIQWYFWKNTLKEGIEGRSLKSQSRNKATIWYVLVCEMIALEKYFLIDSQWKRSENTGLRVQALQCNVGYDSHVLLWRCWNKIKELNVLIWIPLTAEQTNGWLSKEWYQKIKAIKHQIFFSSNPIWNQDTTKPPFYLADSY